MHEHHYSGQTLRHDHEGGDMPHGYYGHPEDYAAGDPVPGTYRNLSGDPMSRTCDDCGAQPGEPCSWACRQLT